VTFIANICKKAFDKARPWVESKGPLRHLSATMEATEAFLFVFPKRTTSGAHIRDHADTKRYMSIVIVGLLPCLLFGIYNVGYQHLRAVGEDAGVLPSVLVGLRSVLPIIIVSYGVGGFWEVLFAQVRKHEINEGFLVTGLLLPLIVPPSIPLWQLAVAISFGVVIGKEVFGGTGMNIMNPALTARAFLFFAYADRMTGDGVWIFRQPERVAEGVTGATPLGALATHAATAAERLQADAGAAVEPILNGLAADYSWLQMALGRIPGSIGETSLLCCALGAFVLIATGVGSWRIMLSVLVGAMATATLFYVFRDHAWAMEAVPPHYHLAMGGFAFGLVFMATDPVSAAQTNAGKYVYGLLIGMVVIIVRTVNPAFPEGMMLTILLMNVFAPLIDHCVVQLHIRRRLKRVQQPA
jgi:Na+-transporting NADH:ubiquinone oxidoreductase subunit B